jgi:hypothetical protein
MKRKIECKEVLKHICDLENISEIDKLEPDHIEHINGCGNCQGYLRSLKSTVDIYKEYNVNIPDEVKKKLLNNVCCKLQSEK